MKLKLDQIERLALLINHLNTRGVNVRCDRRFTQMEVSAWGKVLYLEEVVDKTGMMPNVRQWVGSTCFFTWYV